MRLVLVLMALWPFAAIADGERAGAFDYYVLSLSWSPTWCALEGDARGSPQCDPERDHGWVLHGLWPQYEEGWPSYCRGTARNPSRADTAAMADITGTAGLAWHAWNKHGRCSGLTAERYFEAARAAFEAVGKPPVLRALKEPVRVPARVIEEAFLEVNPELEADMITITCKSNRIQEARICLTKDLEPRVCGPEVIRDCRATGALIEPIR